MWLWQFDAIVGANSVLYPKFLELHYEYSVFREYVNYIFY